MDDVSSNTVSILILIVSILILLSRYSRPFYRYIRQRKDGRKNAYSHKQRRIPPAEVNRTPPSAALNNNSIEHSHPLSIYCESVTRPKPVEQRIEEMEFHRILIYKRDKLQAEIVELEYRLRALKGEIQKKIHQKMEIEKYNLQADMPIEAVVKTLALQDGIFEHKNFYESYDDYLKSDLWKAKRAIVLVRDNDTCQICGARATQVHHQRYPRNLGSEPISWLIAICDPCHDETHGKPGRV